MYVDDIGIYTTNDTIEEGTNYHLLTPQVTKEEWFRNLADNQEKALVTFNHAPDSINPYQTKEYFSIVRTLDDYSVFSNYRKYLKIDINLKKIEAILNREKPYLSLQLVNEQGQPILPLLGGRTIPTSFQPPMTALTPSSS